MKVKIFSTQMGEREIETQATTWEGLQKDLRTEGISFSKMKAVIGENKLTLEAGGAQLPAQGFTLFLMNKKTKAGASDIDTMSYKELRSSIKDILANNDEAKNYFNEGKNYTTKGTEVLRSLLASFSGVELSPVVSKLKKKKVKKEKTKEPKRGFGQDKADNETISKAQKAVDGIANKPAKTISDVVESVKDSKEDTTEVAIPEGVIVIETEVGTLLYDANKMFNKEQAGLLETNLKTILDGLKDFTNNYKYFLKLGLEEAAEKIAQAKAEEKEQREAEAREITLRNQMDDMMGEFSDVK
jgi:hypothetical protein